MAQQTMYPAKVNSPMAELSAGITSSATTIALVDASPLPAAPNLAVIGTAEDAETILYTGISGNSLTGVTRAFQGTAKAWSTGAKVARFFTAYDADTFRSNIQDLDSRVQSTENWFTGMSRQALINGNFDVWQRGTSFSTPSNGAYLADRWCMPRDGSGQVYTVSQQLFTAGQTDVPNEPKYFFRYQCTTAATGQTYNQVNQRIESVRTFAGKKATVSFYAKADTARTVSVSVVQDFGSGGSPQAYASGGGNISLTTAWQKFVCVFTLPSISGKTIGSNDYLGVAIGLPLNSTCTIDLAQVQINAGDVALPFLSSSFADELALCQRYYQRGLQLRSTGTFYNSSNASLSITHIVPMRVPPTPSKTGSVITLDDVGSGTLASTASLNSIISTVDATKVDIGGFTGANIYRYARMPYDDIQLDAEI